MKLLHSQRPLVRLLAAFSLIASGVSLGIGLSADRATATPAPNQLVWQLPGQNAFDEQGVSVAASFDATPILFAGLRTDAALSLSGNHISVRAYSGINATQVLTIPAPLQQSAPSPNVVAVIGVVTGSGSSASEFAVGTPVLGTVGNDLGGLVRLFDSTGTLLHTFVGSGINQQFGAAVAAAGDVDGDGYPDILIGAPGANAVYVYSGSSAKSYGLIATLSGSASNEGFGFSVGLLGQIATPSGGSRPVVLVGAPFNQGNAPSGSHGGRIYAIALNPQPFPPSIVYTVAGSGATDLLGTSVDGGVDITGDSVPDFLGGALGSDPGSNVAGTGYVRLYSGADGSVIRTLTSSQVGDLFGASARLGGPCLGAARTVIVGAPQALSSGTGFITGRVLGYNAATGAQLTEIYGEHQGEAMGTSVSASPDLSGDGEAEFLAGSPGTPLSLYQTGAGAAWAFSCREIPRPKIVVAPNPASLGSVAVGTPKTIDIGITNLGPAKLDVSQIALDPLPLFSPYSYTGPVTASIAPATTQTVTVRFAPSVPGLHMRALHILSNDPMHPGLDVDLTGLGLLPQLQATPASIAFGSVDVNDTRWATLTVKNVGNAPATVKSITLSGGSSPDFSLVAVPMLPVTLGQNQARAVKVLFKPSAIGARTGAVQIVSDDPTNPTIQVPLTGAGVQPNKPPVAIIKMDVPYTFNGNTVAIQFHGDSSFDPDGTVVSYQWDFGDGSTSSAVSPPHTFAFKSVCPCYYVVKLKVTDNGGKSDPTSVTIPVPQPLPPPPNLAVASVSATASGPQHVSDATPGVLRSRFWGTVKRGGSNLPEGTLVEAWTTVKITTTAVYTRVAESLTQMHLGQSVFAIEVPPYVLGNPPQLGGTDGVRVDFRVDGAQASQSGTWWNATDQRLDLTAPGSWVAVSPCVLYSDLEICKPHDPLHSPVNVNFDLVRDFTPPVPDPGPLRHINVFKLDLTDAVTGAPVTLLPAEYEIRVSYTDTQLAAAGISNEHTLGLYTLSGGRWVLAGTDTVDAVNKQVITRLNHASVFALMGKSSGGRYLTYLPILAR